MNPTAILSLISDLYTQILQLQAANKELQEKLAKTSSRAMPISDTAGSFGPEAGLPPDLKGTAQ